MSKYKWYNVFHSSEEIEENWLYIISTHIWWLKKVFSYTSMAWGDGEVGGA